MPITHLFFTDDSLIFHKALVAEFGVLKQILHNYELASRHCVNDEKSIMVFSPNVVSDCRVFLSSIRNVRMAPQLGSYLGLPSIFSYRKARDF